MIFGFHWVGGTANDVLPITSGRALRDAFVRNNGCTPQNPPEPANGSLTHIITTYSGCRAGSAQRRSPGISATRHTRRLVARDGPLTQAAALLHVSHTEGWLRENLRPATVAPVGSPAS